MSKNQYLDSSIWGDKLGQIFDLFKTEYTYKNKRGESLESHPKGKTFIRGFVPDEFSPVEGQIFKMYHYETSGGRTFGQVFVDTCTNVSVSNSGIIYFEDKLSTGKYILVPCHTN